MSIFRSENMFLYKIVMAKDNAKEITSILGNRNLAQFINMNEKEQVFTLPYSEIIKRCEESEAKVKYIVGRCLINFVKLVRAENINEMNDLLRDVAKFKNTT